MIFIHPTVFDNHRKSRIQHYERFKLPAFKDARLLVCSSVGKHESTCWLMERVRSSNSL